MSKPDGAMAIGRHLYLFTAKVPTDECLITAHGGAFSGNKMFDVPPGVKLNFYVPHGFTLQDPGLALVYSRPAPSEMVVGPAQCHEYDLSKYQGRHGNNSESYDDISSAVHNESMNLVRRRRAVADARPGIKRQIAQDQLSQVRPFNVVTIRNRFGSSGVHLSDVITQVRQVVPMIRVFHCSFCRSHMHIDTGASAGAGQY